MGGVVFFVTARGRPQGLVFPKGTLIGKGVRARGAGCGAATWLGFRDAGGRLRGYLFFSTCQESGVGVDVRLSSGIGEAMNDGNEYGRRRTGRARLAA